LPPSFCISFTCQFRFSDFYQQTDHYIYVDIFFFVGGPALLTEIPAKIRWNAFWNNTWNNFLEHLVGGTKKKEKSAHMPAVLLARADICTLKCFHALELNTHRNSPQQNATKYPTKKRNPVKKNFLERKCVAAKVAKFRLIVFCVASAFRFFSFTVLCPENWGAATANVLTFFFNIVFSLCLIFFCIALMRSFLSVFLFSFFFLCEGKNWVSKLRSKSR
jgi:K+-sensing histidine kinase KdpD